MKWLLILLLVCLGQMQRVDSQEYGYGPPAAGGTGDYGESWPGPATYASPSPSPAWEKSYSAVASDVYDAVLDEDIPGVAREFESSNNVGALAEGLRFPADRRADLLRKSEGREGDPDVVTMKAIAQAALSSKKYYDLSRVLTESVYPGGNEKVRWELEQLLKDRELMERVRVADPKTEFVPPQGRRRLYCDGCTPVNSFVCAHCWVSVVCAKFHWCPKV